MRWVGAVDALRCIDGGTHTGRLQAKQSFRFLLLLHLCFCLYSMASVKEQSGSCGEMAFRVLFSGSILWNLDYICLEWEYFGGTVAISAGDSVAVNLQSMLKVNIASCVTSSRRVTRHEWLNISNETWITLWRNEFNVDSSNHKRKQKPYVASESMPKSMQHRRRYNFTYAAQFEHTSRPTWWKLDSRNNN